MLEFRRWIHKLRNLLLGNRFDNEMDEEMQFHLESLIQENLKSGVSPEQARQAAMICFGGIDQTKEECRDTRWMRILGEIRRDLHYGFRMMHKSPGLMLTAILILALGIGANTAIVTFIDAVIFRPPAIPAPGRVLLSPTAWSVTDYRDIRKDEQAFTGLAAYLALPAEVRDPGSTLITVKGVSANFFQVIGFPMSAGRGFALSEDDFAGNYRVAIISDHLWQRSYQRDPAAVGKNLQLNGESATIVGVAPQDFHDPFGGFVPDAWVSFPMFLKVVHMDPNQIQVMEGEFRSFASRDLRALNVFGRLKKGISREQAAVRMDLLASNLQKIYPKTNGNWKPSLLPLNGARWPGRDNLFSYALLMGAGICILLITCMNVANLLLARGSARTREIAVRVSLGAGRLRVIRQLLTEGLVLSAAAVLAGLAVCTLALKAMPLIAAKLGAPASLELSVDLRVLLFAACIGLLTNLLFGLAPALVVSRTELISLTRYQEFFGMTRIGSRWRHALVTIQMALSVILLIAAGLFVKTVLRFRAMDIGYNRQVLIMRPDIVSLLYDPNMQRPEIVLSVYRQSLNRIRALPGVRSVSFAEDLPLDGFLSGPGEMDREPVDRNKKEWPHIRGNSVSQEYFKTVGIPILQGRDFSERDNETAPGVVIINETLARRFWPGQNPLGKRMREKATNRSFEVIGVAKDVKYEALGEKPTPYAYFHYEQAMMTFHMDLLVRTSGDPRLLVGAIRAAVQTVDSRVAVDNIRLMSEHLDSYMLKERAAVYVFGLFGPLSLVLAGIGLYGIISYSVARRSHEFGIRVALGARRDDIQRLVLQEGMISTFLGLALGLPLSMAAAGIIASRFQQVSAFDPGTYIAIPLICLAVSTAATLLPARRACADPWNSLRNE